MDTIRKAQAQALRAVTYARTSSDMQSEESPDDQRRECHELARKMGFDIVANYEDVAMSGANNKRPQFQRVLADAKRKQFDVLLVFDLSRFTRDLIDQESAIRPLEHAGIRIVS